MAKSPVTIIKTVFCFLVIGITLSQGSRNPSNGCNNPQAVPLGDLFNLELSTPSSGGGRSFLLDLPASYTPQTPNPLILAFHGKGQTASDMRNQTQFSSPFFNNDTIVVYPQGIDKQWTGDPAAPPTSLINDVTFAADLIAYLTTNLCIDVTRIYTAGFSNGGGLTHLLACDRVVSSKLAAVAIASGAFYKDSALQEPLFSHCSPSLVMPVLEFHGGADPVEHYDGEGTPDGEGYSIPSWLCGWAVRNGCDEEPEEESEVLFDGIVERSSWGTEDVVVHYFIHGFGHGWPSTRAQDDDSQRYGPAKFNATGLIMEWFGRWKLDDKGDEGMEKTRKKDEL